MNVLVPGATLMIDAVGKDGKVYFHNLQTITHIPVGFALTYVCIGAVLAVMFGLAITAIAKASVDYKEKPNADTTSA